MIDLAHPNLSLFAETDNQKSPKWVIVVTKQHHDLSS